MIERFEELSKEFDDQMTVDSIKYEANHGVHFNFKNYYWVATNPSNPQMAIGILQAYTVFCEIYVEHLWVHESYRKQGYGKQLLDSVETYFKGQGFNNINLVTNGFQAPEFYKKCGYTLEFTRRNKQHPKLDKFFFVKFFHEEKEHQGLIPPCA